MYPDSSVESISSFASFTIPKYKLVGATSFTASVYVHFTRNGNQVEGKLAELAMTQSEYTIPEQIKDTLTSLALASSPANICGCSGFGSCNSLTG